MDGTSSLSTGHVQPQRVPVFSTHPVLACRRDPPCGGRPWRHYHHGIIVLKRGPILAQREGKRVEHHEGDRGEKVEEQHVIRVALAVQRAQNRHAKREVVALRRHDGCGEKTAGQFQSSR